MKAIALFARTMIVGGISFLAPGRCADCHPCEGVWLFEDRFTLLLTFRGFRRRIAARRSNRDVEQWPRLYLRSRRAEPALRLSLFLWTDIVRPAGIKLAAGLGCLRRCGAGASALGASWPSADVRG